MPFVHYQGKNILFVHIPKTGGVSIEAWLKNHAAISFLVMDKPAVLPCSPQHLPYQHLTALFAKNFFDYAFAVVRNPYARLESEYRWAHRHAAPERGFSGWVRKTLIAYASNPWILDNHIRPQTEFLAQEVRAFRLEQGLAPILARVAEDTGLPLHAEDVTHYNKAEHFAHVIADIPWDAATRELVNAFYAKDFAALGYPVIQPEASQD